MRLAYVGGGTTDGEGAHSPIRVGEISATVDAYDSGTITAQSVEVPGVGWVTVIVQSQVEASALAAARVLRAGSDLLAVDCRPVAHAVADALVAAGLGGG